MATGDFADQSIQPKGNLVPTIKSFNRTLLPYEREFCAVIGCTVEEYEQYLEELQKYSYIRPAAYANIPDIQNVGPEWAIVISLAIGLASTAASYFLTPKPRALEDNQGRTINAPGRRGRDRFSQSTSFDGFADLAEYGEAIPIIWTKYVAGSPSTGGVVIAPLLIWSRAYSLASQQAAKMVYLVGESGASAPDIAGVFIGNTSLQVQSSSNYLFQWNGRPEANASAITNTTDTGFYACLTPSNTTQFGVANPIPNMTNYRVNWQVISFPDDIEDGKNENDIRNQRRKICGDGSRDAGMPGAGRNYPRRQGVIAASKGASGNVFRISGKRLNRVARDYTKPTTITTEEINDALDSECIAADEALQVGAELVVGTKLVKVVSRSANLWQRGRDVDITLDAPVPGGPLDHFARDEAIGSEGETYSVTYYPLCRAVVAAFRNNRRCDATEIGIKSQVWKRVNGLANFRRIPSPNTLKEYDEDNVQFNLGNNSEYTNRVSMFSIQYRAVGTTAWTDATSQIIGVRGSTPTDQYYQITVNHGASAEYEFRILPVSSGIFQERSLTQLLLVDNNASIITSGALSLKGRIVDIFDPAPFPADLFAAPSFFNRGWGSPAETISYPIPASVTYNDIYGVGKDVNGNPAVFRLVRNDNPDQRLRRALFEEWFGQFEPGIRRSVVINTDTDRGSVRVKVNVISNNSMGQWELITVDILDARPNADPDGRIGRQFVAGETFTIKQKMKVNATWLTGKVPDWVASKTVSVRLEVRINSVKIINSTPEDRGWRFFEAMATFAEISRYGSLVTHSCDSGPEHEVVYVNQKGGASLGSYSNVNTAMLALRSNRNIASIDQLRLWIKSGVNNSNSFPDLVLYLLQNVSGINPSMIDRESFAAARTFCNNNKLYYDGAITSRTNLRSFITSTAPFFLLNFVLKNGKMALIPALNNGSPSAMFTAGNIIEDSFALEYLDIAERRNIRAEMIWRQNMLNEFPRNRSFVVGDSATLETFDMSSFCTSEQHARTAGQYICAVRKLITHSIKFKTTVDMANVAPGSIITVALDQIAVSRFNNGTINASGLISSTWNMPDGDYTITYFKAGDPSVQTATLTVVKGRTGNPLLWGSIFSVIETSSYSGTYLVEQVELDEEGLVSISASEYPHNNLMSAIPDLIL